MPPCLRISIVASASIILLYLDEDLIDYIFRRYSNTFTSQEVRGKPVDALRNLSEPSQKSVLLLGGRRKISLSFLRPVT